MIFYKHKPVDPSSNFDQYLKSFIESIDFNYSVFSVLIAGPDKGLQIKQLQEDLKISEQQIIELRQEVYKYIKRHDGRIIESFILSSLNPPPKLEPFLVLFLTLWNKKIDNNTTVEQFMRAFFGGAEPVEKIQWTGTLYELSQFWDFLKAKLDPGLSYTNLAEFFEYKSDAKTPLWRRVNKASKANITKKQTKIEQLINTEWQALRFI